MTSNPRPKIVTWLSVIVLIFSAVQLVGAFAWFSLPELPLAVPRGYLLFKNLFWGVLSLAAGTGMLIGRSWALTLSRWGAAAYLVFQTINITVLQSSEYALRARTFNISATLGSVMLFYWLSSRPGVHNYFRRKAG